MPRFTSTRAIGGYVNLDHVATVRSAKDTRGDNVHELFTAAGERLATTYVEDFELLTAPVVAAAPGTMAIAISVFATSDCSRPTEKNVCVSREPIVAWRITETYAVPVFTDDAAHNVHRLIVLPGGELRDPSNCTYHDIESAKKCILDDAQKEWDDEHKSI